MNEWDLLWRLALALALSSIIGFERELGQKNAGLRTYALVGLGSALFMTISKYGFSDVLRPGHVVLDPSRVAAQIVSGIGFIGAGLIFVRRGSVKGLTTAAGVWLTAAVGAAAGASLPIVAVAATAGYLLVALVYPWTIERVRGAEHEACALRVTYEDGRGILREVIVACAQRGLSIDDVAVDRSDERGNGKAPLVNVRLKFRGPRPMADLVGIVGELDGVHTVQVGDVTEIFE